jgi:hypothetical protein
MIFLWITLAIPAAWILWQALKVSIGIFAPLKSKTKGALIFHLKNYNISREEIGEEALDEFSEQTAMIAKTVSKTLNKPLASEIWGGAYGQAALIAEAVSPESRTNLTQDGATESILAVLHRTKSTLIQRLEQIQ